MLNPREQQDVRDRAADLVVNWQIERRGSLDSMTEDGYLDLVHAAAIVQEESNFSLQRWVSASRRAGSSWEQVGSTLGVSRQAAQKRFAVDAATVEPSDKEEKVRTGVNAFNEVAVLTEEGAAGFEVVGAGFGKLFLRQVHEPVENVRVVSLRRGRPIAEMEADGWTHTFSWYPYTYFTRVKR